MISFIIRRKSKGRWDLFEASTPKSTISKTKSSSKSDESDEEEDFVIDLTEISSSEIPSDLSIDENNFWSDDDDEYLNEFERHCLSKVHMCVVLIRTFFNYTLFLGLR